MPKTLEDVKNEMENIIFWPEPSELEQAYNHMNTKENKLEVLNEIALNVISNSDKIKQTILFAVENGIDID